MNPRELRQQIGQLLVEQQSVLQKGLNADNRSAYDKRQKQIETLEADLARVEAFEQRDRESRSFERSPRPTGSNYTGTYSGDEQRDIANRSFRSWAQTGRMPSEARDLLTTSDATGAAPIPQGFDNLLNEALRFYGPIANYVDVRRTDSGNPIKYSFANDTQNSLTLLPTEGTSSPAETDPAFFSKIVGTDTLSMGLVKISQEELMDSAFNLDTFIRNFMGVRYARGLEKLVTLGTDGAGTTLPNSATGGLLANAAVGQTTTAIANGIGWDDLTQLSLGSGVLDPAYAGPTAAWSMSSATRGYLIGLKDGWTLQSSPLSQ